LRRLHAWEVLDNHLKLRGYLFRALNMIGMLSPAPWALVVPEASRAL